MWSIQSEVVGPDGPVCYFWIPNFNNIYVIGDDGSVWSRYKGGGLGYYVSDEWKKLNPVMVDAGCLHISLYFNGVKCFKKVHQLVCEAVYGPCPVGMEVCHNDNDQTNNWYWNLRYDTHIRNMADKVIHGTDSSGERNGTAKNTWVEIREIRMKYAKGEYGIKNLALGYGLSVGSVWRIVNNLSWVEK